MRLYGWCLLGLLSLHAAATEVIAHRAVPGDTLSLASARALFGLRLSRWPDGMPVKLFVLPDSNPVHTMLCKEQLNLYPYQLRQSWDRLVYSGMAQAPIEVANEEEMISRVAKTPGALGYVGKVKKNDAIKKLAIE